MIAGEDILRSLMIRSQSGDKQAYAVLLGECQSWLKRYYRAKIAPDSIDDLVQEVLISLHRKRASYDISRPFLPWLAAIARFRWIDRLRQDYRSAAQSLSEDIPVDDHGHSVAARLGLDGLLAHLPRAQAEAIRLAKIEGYSISETGARTGQSDASVKVNIHRGLKKLAATLESE